MTGLFWGEKTRLKTYSAVTKSGKSVVKLEIETTDPYELAHLIRNLDEIEVEQLAAAKAAKPQVAKSKKAHLALPAPMLQIPHFRGEDD